MKRKSVNFLFIVGLMLTSIWTFGQTIDQVINDLDAERYTAALDGAERLAISSPSEETFFLKGYTILKSPEYNLPENLKEAQEAFEEGEALGKGRRGSPLNRVGLGMVKLASKDRAGAKDIFDEVKKTTRSRDADILYRIAEAYTMFEETNDPAEAVLTIDAALERQKVNDNPEYYFVKADAFILKSDGGSAMTALQYAEELPDKKAKTYAKMARIWLQSRNYRDALKVIENGIAADPTFSPIYRFQSSYYHTFHDYPKAASAAENYLKYSDGDVKAKLRYAKLVFLSKEYASVKRVLGEIKGLVDDPYIHRMEGIVHFEEGDYEQAIKDFEAFIKADTKDENPGLDYGYIGRAYLMMENDNQEENNRLGVMNLDKAVSLKDTSMNYYEEAANIFFERKDNEKAAEMTEKGFKIKKDPHAGDYASVALAFFRARDWVKADEYFDKSLEEYEDQWTVGYAYSGFAKTYRYMEDSVMNATYPGAPQFEKYLELLGEEGINDPANSSFVIASLKTLAGRDFLVEKDPEAALKKIEKVLELNPDDEDAVRMMHRFKKIIDPDYVIPGTEEEDEVTDGAAGRR